MTGKREDRTPAGDSDVAAAIRRWSDAKLDFGSTFAEAGVVDTWPATITWRDVIRAEVERRAEAAGPTQPA